MPEDKKKKGAETKDTKPKAQDTKPADEKITVNRADLEKFLKRLENLEADNKKLIAVADKGRLHHEDERRAREAGAPLIHTCKLTRMGSDKGRLVVAWKLLDNESYVDGNRLVEKQNVEVFYQDGSSDKMRLIDFYRGQNKQTVVEIIKRTMNDATGELEFEVELRDGERITIPAKFVN